MDKSDALKQIAVEVSQCERCVLHMSRKNAVPGDGNPNAEIMFIGEGPGFHENEQGLPFVGAAGKFLEELLASINLRRVDVFITNVVKCRPPSNRDPQPEELAACNDFLERQISIINPKVIVTLGRYSMAKFLPNAKISVVHGTPKWINGRLIVPMYHPAAALHQGSLKPQLEADFIRLPELMEKSINPPQINQSPASSSSAPTMMDLFWQSDSAAENESIPSPEGLSESNSPTQLTLF